MRFSGAAEARFDSSRITDVRRCLAIEGSGYGRVGIQCRRKPRKGRMMCTRHRQIEGEVGISASETFAEARRQAAALAHRSHRRGSRR
jgi:hypothetical protein